MQVYDVLVIGGGPAGLCAALAANGEGVRVLLLEREERLGGILKQCIHDGFGLLRFGEKLSGPEYVERFEEEFYRQGIACETQTFVTDIRRESEGFLITAVNCKGVQKYQTGAIVLATGCRERTAKQVFIHGTRPAGVFTAGTAQHFVNLMGEMPGKRCVILGSGDIGLIMARRMTLEGAQVLGVYEAKKEPSGLTRNLVQCLEDYQIPLYLSKTVTRVFGEERLRAVEIADVDDGMRPISGTEMTVECDTLILSVGLIPENEIAESLGVSMDLHTKGPLCDQRLMTDVDGVFSCGNALHVNDLVDYVSESGELAGKEAAGFGRNRRPGGRHVKLETDATLQYLVPQLLDVDDPCQEAVLYFRSSRTLPFGVLRIRVDGRTVLEKNYRNLRPPEMERLKLDFGAFGLTGASRVQISIEAGGGAA